MARTETSTKPLARHIIKVAPKSAKVVFENDLIRVNEITMRKDQKIPMHSHNKGLSYSLNKGRMKSVDAHGKSGVFEVEKGELSWSNEVESHAVENLGGPLREHYVEFKD